ncbi:MAG: hypothetical protein IKA31_04315, partial [Clostridia bacterium]|nr:hypothetical protein [Clostridia bacterium]
EGSTEAGIVEMLLSLSYVYNDQDGSIVFVPNSYDTYYTVEKYFNVVVSEDSNEDNPTPIYDEEDLINVLSKATVGSFILMNDITINKHTALSANFSSFDGNNKIITINSFNYNTDIIGSTGNYSINLGLFNTVSNKTIIKNVIVAYPANKIEAMNLSGYSNIKFGGIAAINNGIITNCDVISVTENKVSLNNYNDVDYTLNVKTAVTIGSSEVKTDIGGLVAVNNSTGIITNSRVGRDTVEVLKVYDNEATVVYKENYSLTAPITAFKVEGRANVGGFVATNNGTISTSFAKNLQLEVVGGSTRLVKTAGFVVSNTGYVYGSYAAGWEEEEGNTEGIADNISNNRKLGGGLYSDGFIGGFVYSNEAYIEDCYSNINVSGDLMFAAKTTYIKQLIANGNSTWASNAVGGFVFSSTKDGYITTSYSLSKISSDKLNTHGAFEGKIAPSSTYTNEGTVDNCYFMLERKEDFEYDHEQARMLSDDPVIDLEGTESISGTNEFIVKASFNNFSFDNSITDFKEYNGESTGGVWAIYQSITGNNGYPELISANTIAISCRVINVTKTNNSDTNTYYYTYVDGYDIGSYLNPHLVSTFEQYNNIFRDTIGEESFNENITAKFTGNIRLINNINFHKSEKVYSTSVEFTSLVNLTSIFDGNYLAMYNIKLADSTEEGQTSFGLFKDIYYAAVKNVTLVIDSVYASQTYAVGGLAGVIVNSNISNVTLVASSDSTGTITGNNYVGGLAGVVVSKHEENFYSVSDIKSNLAIVGGADTDGEISAITTSFIVWERIKPTSNSSGLSEINNNLRLHKLPTTVHYAGGIIGFADMHQVSEVADDTDIKDANIYNVHVGKFIPNTILSTSDVSYNRIVSVNTDYAGGLFGFVGAQTYVECAEFIAVAENEQHFIKANEIAGGITAVNLGKISQAYVSFEETVVVELNNDIVDYVNRNSAANVNINDTLFASGEPSYIGGIAGINVGNGTSLGTGNIIDSYNRVDVKNSSAKGVGGIVGGTYIGQISNVYTTASLMGDLTNFETRMGGIVGKIFENGEDGEGYFADYYEDGSDYSIISMFNIVALNLWDKDDFDDLFEFVRDGGYIGALYGKYENLDEETSTNIEEEGLIRLTGSIFVQNYAIKDFSNPYISSVEQEDQFDVRELGEGNYFELWGVQPKGNENYDYFLNAHLCGDDNSESLIYPNDYRALFSGTEFGVSTLRETYFPSTKWSRVIWNFEWNEEEEKHRLPVLDYGYESSVIRIYTAHQFVNKLKEGNSSGKLFVIMNDIDFTNVTNVFPIATTFRGHLYGNNVTYKDSITGYTYTRKPILFNIS